ncbi:MAG: CaiB/BaiF CoA-transferase family protein [Pseudomonadota bacterium]
MSDLAGTLVVSLEHAVAAPYASCKLADAGARVIKVERPEGDFARNYDQLVNGASAYFVWINRGKESICLDLKVDEDRAVFSAMLERADVFIQNLAPGVVDRLGFPAETLRKANPGLIVCSISGYGSDGPSRDQKAYDLLIQAETGLSAINGTEHGPARVGVSVCDIAAGMTAYQAILLGLIGRAQTGQGRTIEVSLFHAMADWMNVPYLQYRYGKKVPQRLGLKHPTIAPYGAFACADGKDILISVQNEREWGRFCRDVLQRPELISMDGWKNNSERVANRDEVDRCVGAFFARIDRSTAVSMLEKTGIAFGRLSDLDDLISHPQHRLVSVSVNGADIELLAPGAVVKGKVDAFGAVPEKGQDDAHLRVEFASDQGCRLAGE